MKVLQINSSCGIGSIGRIATDIDKILLEQGHESYIAYGRDIPRECDNAIRIGNKLDIYIHVALSRLLDKHGFGSKKATINFINKIEKMNPDVIHLHNIHGYYINVELLFEYLVKANKPIIWTLHDCWAFTGHCSYFDYVGCDKWKTGCKNCPQRKSYPAGMLMDNSYNNFNKKRELFTRVKNMTIITPSEWLTKLVNESCLNKYPIKTINNGIDLNVFKPTNSTFREKYNLANKFIILGVASIWERRKGYEYFMELSKKLSEDERIVMVGLNEKQKSRLPNNIIGITKTHNTKELAEIYSIADVFINPTLEDNFPTTNLEALACGTPIITFNTGGSSECLDDTCGIIVEKGNIEGIINIIKMLKVKNFSAEKCVSKAKLYDKNERFKDYVSKYLEGYESLSRVL